MRIGGYLCCLHLICGAGCVVSRDGRWVAGISCERPAYVFCNRKERCLHANPVFDDLKPGQTARASSYIHILRGDIGDFDRVIRDSTGAAGF